MYGYLNVVRYLVKQKADIYITDAGGNTPLMRAKKYNHKKVAEFLKKILGKRGWGDLSAEKGLKVRKAQAVIETLGDKLNRLGLNPFNMKKLLKRGYVFREKERFMYTR